MKIKWIDVKDELLLDVKILGKANAKTLGFFPEGAFEEYAWRKMIAVGLIEGKLAGYVLFRISQTKRILYITHLCVDSFYRKSGVAKGLLDAVKEKHKNNCNGMGLNCREDYTEASAFWQRYGFKPKKRKPGRGKDGYRLITWYFDFGNPDLFRQNDVELTKIFAVLDSNILIKLRDDKSGKEEEVLALHADWLADDVEYYYAQEFFVEINSDKDQERADRTRSFIANYHELRWNAEDVDSIYPRLAEILTGNSNNDHCDRRQIAETIAAEIDFFITLDTGILNAAEKLEKEFGIKVFRPSEFILYMDYHRNNTNYRSYRVAGAQFEYHQITSSDTEKLCETFVAHNRGEKIKELKSLIYSISADVNRSEIKIVRDNQQIPIGFFAVAIADACLIIRVIRTVKSKAGYLLFQQMIGDIFTIAMKKSADIIRLSDSYVEEDKEDILLLFGFQKCNDGYWQKVLLQGQHYVSEILTLPAFAQAFDVETIRHSIENAAGQEKMQIMYQLERALFPAKILDLTLPTYIVPIRPYWASQLFDHYIARHTAFGANIEQAWRKENVYYRSVRPVSEKAPGRILWYISSEKHYWVGRSSGIAAVSYLDEVYIDAAKHLFLKFRDFGIYSWQEIKTLTNDNAMAEIKALRFSDTEVFKKIVSFTRVNQIFQNFGRSKNTFASPVEISSDIFHEIYSIGKTKQ